MKNPYFFAITLIVAAMMALVACNENIIDETINEQEIEDDTEFNSIQIINQIEVKDLPENMQVSDLKVLSLNGEESVDIDGTTKVMTYEGYLPQLIMLTDSNDELLLMARGNFHEGETNEISVR